MAKEFYETIIASGGFAGEVFDVAAGPANTGVIDVLLSAGDGTLTQDAPINMISTGALGATRDLDITGIEDDGRVFFISVRNSDITTNDLTITATTDINGGGTTLTVSEATDYLFVHETGGTWRAYVQSQSVASGIFRDTFVAGDWTGGTAHEIDIIQTGAPGAGDIGPHGLAIASSYLVQVYADANDRQVRVGVEINGGTGDITLVKAPLAPNFAGRVIVGGTS